MQKINTMTKDVPETPIIGNKPQNWSKIIPRFWPGKPDNIQDLIHSKMKNILGRINIFNLDCSKYFIETANNPRYIER